MWASALFELMNRYFISGGSAGIPKDICHNSLEWQYIILDTASVLQTYGVKAGSVVLIAQPSFPWSIGEVFAQASGLCGADTICYGLQAGEKTFSLRWADKKVSHIIVNPNLLFKWMSEDVKPLNGVSLIVVGEALGKTKEEKIQELCLPSDIRRIYGMSELGTLGYQFQSKSPLLCMNPRFNYWLEGNETPNSGDVGNLIIDPKHGGEIVVTKDVVRVFNNNQNCQIWNKTFIIEFLNRGNNSLTLSDGTTIDESVINSLISKFELNNIQCIYNSEKGKEYLIFNYVSSNLPINEEDLLREILVLVPELCDEFAKRTYLIEINRIEFSELKTTERGKFPLFLDKSD